MVEPHHFTYTKYFARYKKIKCYGFTHTRANHSSYQSTMHEKLTQILKTFIRIHNSGY